MSGNPGIYPIAAIILAAGYSSRMKAFKPLLKLDGVPAVKRVIDGMEQAGVMDIILVTGYQSDRILSALGKTSVRIVFNENYQEGMYASILKGMGALNQETEAFFLMPGDIPLVKSETIRELINYYRENKAKIIYPSFLGEKGHPPLISTQLKQMILENQAPGGLRSLLERFESVSLTHPVVDQGICMDMDTRTDYEGLLQYNQCSYYPNPLECQAILKRYQTSDQVIAHSKRVRQVADVLGRRLAESGYLIDLGLLGAASMLHDVVKGRPLHDRQGGEILTGLGYPQVGRLIESHMEIEIDWQAPVTEAEILYLADKLVSKDQIVPLKDQEKAALGKYACDPVVSLRIKRRMNQARKILDRILVQLQESEDGLLDFRQEQYCL